MALTKDRAKALTRLMAEEYPEMSVLAYKFGRNAEEMYRENANKVPEGMKGGYIPIPLENKGRQFAGRVDVLLDNIRDERDFLETLRHEVIGHYGANTFAPKEKEVLLDGLIAARNEPYIKSLWAAVDANYAGLPLEHKAEEVFALYCEGIAPVHHVNSPNIAALGQRSLTETCIEQSRPMQIADLDNIACMVAQGLRDRSRTQQTFPHIKKPGDEEMDALKPKKKTFHEVVAEKLIEQLKAGTAPWQRPWQPGEPNSYFPMNPTSGKRYKGINAIHLMAQGRSDSRWMTYKQAAATGAQVRKGEKGTPVQYWKLSEEQTKLDDSGKPVLDARGKPVKETVKLERPRVFFATVFNGEQIDGLPSLQPAKEQEQTWNALERAEKILEASGAEIKTVPGNRAFYRPSTDSITLPERGQFPSADRYYATALHELGHWTGHESRLARDLSHPFGSEGYAKEELRAEIASMILGDELGIGHDPEQHVAYVGSWIKVLEDEPLEVFRAAADAEKIHDYVLAFEQKQVQEQQAEAKLGQTQEDAEMQIQDDKTQHIAKEARKVAEAVASEKQEQRRQDQEKSGRLYINVPFNEKNEAKVLGAKWDKAEKSWFVPGGVDSTPFAKWKTSAQAGQQVGQKAEPARQYLAVPYEQRATAKAAGALWDKQAKSWYAGSNADQNVLKQWKPENVAGRQEPSMTPQQEFTEALKSAGLVLKDGHPIMDGKKHRLPVEGGKDGSLDGSYMAFLDGRPSGKIINFKTGTELNWKSKGYALSDQEKAKLKAEAAEKLAQRAGEQERAQEEAAQRVGKQMTDLVAIDQPTPYLQSKGIQAHVGAMTDREGQKTYIPAFDTDGKQWTMQYIQEDGTKRFAKDSKKEGCFHAIGGMDALVVAPALVIAEGYATAAQVAEAAGHATVAAFDSGNLGAAAKALHAKFPDKPVIIVGDDDRHVVMTHGKNPGREKAEAAAQAVGGKAIFPIFAPGENTYPRDLPAITPDSFKAHLHAEQRLADAAAGKVELASEETAKLKALMLSDAQLDALATMKRHTDFNDLAQKSKLGIEGVKRQIDAAVNKTQRQENQEQQREVEQKQQERPRRAAKIG